MLQRPVVSYANGREIVITFGQEEAPALVLGSPGWAFPRALIPARGRWLGGCGLVRSMMMRGGGWCGSSAGEAGRW